LVLNAALSLQVTGKVKELNEGIETARETITNGKAKEFLSRLIGKDE